MPLNNITRILNELHRSKRAMSPPIPKIPAGAAKGAGGAAKAGGATGGAGGGIGDMLGQMQQMGDPKAMLKGMWDTQASQDIKQNKEKIEQFKESLKNVEQQIKQVKQQISSTEQQIKQAQLAQQDTTGLEQQKQQLQARLRELEEDKSKIEKAISELQSANDKLGQNVWQERKVNALGFAGPEGMAAQQVVQGITGAKDNRIQAKTDKAVQAAGGAGGGEGQPRPSAPHPGPGPAPAGPKPTPSPAPSGGGGSPPKAGGAGGGMGGFASKIMGGGSKGPSDEKAPIGSVLGIIGAALLGAFTLRTAEWDFGTAAPALISIGLLVLGLIVLIATRGRRGIIVWILLILIFGGAAYTFGTRTAPHIFAAIESGQLQRTAVETESAGKQGISSVIDDAVTSYRRSMAVATGQRIEGDVDQTVKEEVGIEILPPYLPNPDRINQDETPYLEIGGRVKGFDPKTEIQVQVVCNMQTRAEAQSISRAVERAGQGYKRQTGPVQEVTPESISGFNFERDITCYPEPPTCGDYIITLSANADHLRTDAQMINYMIDKEILDQRLRNYAESYDKELRSQSQVKSAINTIYKGQLGSYRSVSQKGAIKVVMATQDVPLIGVDQNTDVTLRAGVENMKEGWITGINSVQIIIPGYFQPVQGRCRGWTVEGNTLRLTPEYLETADFDHLSKGEQKIFPSCHLIPQAGGYDLTEPTEATFLAAADYDYIVQEQHNLEIRNETGGVCREQPTMSGESSSGSRGATEEDQTNPETSGEETGGEQERTEREQPQEQEQESPQS